MRILVGYECSGVVAAAFRKRGHIAWSVDLQPYRGTDPEGARWHLQSDIWDALNGEVGYIDLGIFHPDCTYLTVSAAWAFKDGPYHQKLKLGTLTGAARRKAREEALGNFRRLMALPFDVVAENPSPSFLGTMYRPADQVIQPHQFGDDASKSTGLWRNCNLPDLKPTKPISPRYVCADCGNHMTYEDMAKYSDDCTRCGGIRMCERWGNQTDSGQNKLSPSPDRAHLRAITYQGIADAMADQWGFQ